MKEEIVRKAAAQFGIGDVSFETLGDGLIHRTYKVTYPNHREVVLQCINQNTFPQPENVIANYREIYDYLQGLNHERIFIPALLQTIHNKFYFVDELGNFWRATEFVPNSYSLALANESKQASLAAQSFGIFTRTLAGLETEKLNVIIKGFHDPQLRYAQFENAVAKGGIKRLLKATHLIAEVRQRHRLVEFFQTIISAPEFRVRIMHHDAKISNVLFDSTTNNPICPVDLDTTMSGYFFSDLGDLVRSAACTVSENSTRWEEIDVRKDVYQAVVEGYLQGIGSYLSPDELKHIHYSGLIMTYMQTIRFLTDFLNNDIYYKTEYPEQNLNRALNQFIFLERLEQFILTGYNYQI